MLAAKNERQKCVALHSNPCYTDHSGASDLAHLGEMGLDTLLEAKANRSAQSSKMNATLWEQCYVPNPTDQLD